MKTKKQYLAPTLDVERIYLEQSIAQASVTPNTINVDNSASGTNQSSDGDFY